MGHKKMRVERLHDSAIAKKAAFEGDKTKIFRNFEQQMDAEINTKEKVTIQ